MAEPESSPRPPAHISAYVDILGVDGTVTFLMTFGGAELYLAARPKRRSRLAQTVGPEKAVELARQSARLPARVPTAKPWIAGVMRSKGLPVAEIARKLHVSDVTVRAYLKRVGPSATADPRQLRLI